MAAAAAAGRPQEPAEPEGRQLSETFRFVTPLVGWGRGSESSFSYALPLYYARRGKTDGARLAVLFPVLSALYRSPGDKATAADGAAVLPLLAVMGSTEGNGVFASGYASPYLAAGAVRTEAGGLKARRSGAAVLPWLPLLEGFFRMNLVASGAVESQEGSYASVEIAGMPGLDLTLVERRRCGIEEEVSLLDVWGVALYRRSLDLPGGGFDPHLRQLDSFGTLADWPWRRPAAPAGPDQESLARAGAVLQSSRSGAPVEHAGILDPMVTLEQRGESLHAAGIEPLFYYHAEEGLSLPLLAACLSPRGLRLGDPAIRHLFPLLHANAEGTRWDFLFNLGTVFALEGYTAIDLKLLFNFQRAEGRGTAWGVLPFPFGHFPGRRLNPGARFVQLKYHALSIWNVDGAAGADILSPFVFSMAEEEGAGRKIEVGPFGLLYSESAQGEDVRGHVLGIFGYEATPRGREIDLLGLTLLKWRTGG